MKIEKVNENQIRCTLTREDLADRHLKLSELAYGTEKAKSLFRDMMQQANYEFGFEAEDIPLMIEAVPISADTIILLISKVEYPDELDTRFSKFSETDDDSFYSEDSAEAAIQGADDILGLFKKISAEKNQANEDSASAFVPLKEVFKTDDAKSLPKEDVNVEVPIDLTKLFVFHRLEEITRLSRVLAAFELGDNTLYKDSATGKYYLVIHKGDLSPENFNRVCNIFSEYAHQESITTASEAFFVEHFNQISAHQALQTFAQL